VSVPSARFDAVDGQQVVTIRPARDDDADTIARIWHEAWGDGHRGNVPDALVRHRGREQFLPRAAERVAHSWIGEHDGTAHGFVTVADDELEQIFVVGAGRGSGLATALIERGKAAIRDAGHDTAWLAVVAGNARARAFYEREGWVDAGPFDYQAETADGLIDVPCRRYTIDLG
jgi:GNAT superfamily N-acetyltransferase